MSADHDAAQLPVIRIAQGQLPRMIREAGEVLRTDPNLYVRSSGELITVVREVERLEVVDRWEIPTGDGARARSVRPRPGDPRIAAMGWATLHERLAGFAEWQRYHPPAQSWIPSHPDRVTVSALLAKPEREGLRLLETVTEAPYLRADDEIVQTAGYDALSRCVLAPSEPFPSVPEDPDENAARGALEVLRDPFQDFPFRSGSDRDVPIAALLTLLARPAIGGATPMFLFDASTRGSGKSLLTHAISTIVTGRTASMQSWPSDEVELDKQLGALALSGSTLVAFDNIEAPIASATLNRTMTTPDRVRFRILGTSEMPVLPWRAVVLLTGNNLEIRGDAQRRGLLCRLEPLDERPEERETFRYPYLLSHLRAARPRLVAAALTLLRAFLVAGAPCRRKWGSFAEWAYLIPAAIEWAGGTNVLETRLTQDENQDPTHGAMLAVLQHWPKLDVTRDGLTVGHAIEILSENIHGPDVVPGKEWMADLHAALELLGRHKSGRGVDEVKIGKAFARHRGQWKRGACLDRGRAASGGVQRWIVRLQSREDPGEQWNEQEER